MYAISCLMLIYRKAGIKIKCTRIKIFFFCFSILLFQQMNSLSSYKINFFCQKIIFLFYDEKSKFHLQQIKKPPQEVYC